MIAFCYILLKAKKNEKALPEITHHMFSVYGLCNPIAHSLSFVFRFRGIIWGHNAINYFLVQGYNRSLSPQFPKLTIDKPPMVILRHKENIHEQRYYN